MVPGEYTVSELAVVGWDIDLSASSCVDSQDNSLITGGTGELAGTAVINVAPDEDVTCTFVNVKRGSIEIIKSVSPDADPADFAFSSNIPTLATFSLDDDGDEANDLRSTTGPVAVAPGEFTVDELTVAGWDLDLAASGCVDQGDPDSDIVAAVGVEGQATINVAPGESVVCTFVNVKRGKIVIKKDAVPNALQNFTFTSQTEGHPFGENGFILDDDEGETEEPGEELDTYSNMSVEFEVEPGTFVLTETPEDGWDLFLGEGGSTCDDEGSFGVSDFSGQSATIRVDPGETVTCTFVNRKRGQITIVKDSRPDDAQDFTFNTNIDDGSPAPVSFSLDDDGVEDNELSSSTTFTLEPGMYTVDEVAVPGWDLDLDESSCTSSDPEDDSAFSEGGTATFNLDAAEEITCTFVNKERGSITIVKDADPANGENFTFVLGGDFTADDDPDATPDGQFMLDDAVPDDADGIGSSVTLNGLEADGTYSISEMLPVPADGWSLTGIECLSDTGGAGGSTFTYGGDGVFTVGDLEAGIQLAAGDSVTCTFTNTKDGSIKVVKSASPADSTEFGFTPSWTETEDTTLANGEMFSESLGPGLYTVSEMLPVPAEGWSLTGIECLSDTGGAGGSTFTYGGDGVFTVGDLEAGIQLAAGDSVTCTFTNTKDGSIKVVKSASPADSTEFGFTPSWTETEDTTLANGEMFSESLGPGLYTVSEMLPVPAEGWSLTGIECLSDTGGAGGSTFTYGGDGVFTVGDLEAGIQLAAGDSVTCTFTNTKDGSIKVVKSASPADSTEFGFTRRAGPRQRTRLSRMGRCSVSLWVPACTPCLRCFRCPRRVGP